MTDMISDICDVRLSFCTCGRSLIFFQELLPDFTQLLMDPFASHVCRALLALLMPGLLPAEQRSSTLRSKKSAAYKTRQGSMKSLFTTEGNRTLSTTNTVPQKFRDTAKMFVLAVREKLDANEVRALAASPVASPVLQVRGSLVITTSAHSSTDVVGSRSRARCGRRTRFADGPNLGRSHRVLRLTLRSVSFSQVVHVCKQITKRRT